MFKIKEILKRKKHLVFRNKNKSKNRKSKNTNFKKQKPRRYFDNDLDKNLRMFYDDKSEVYKQKCINIININNFENIKIKENQKLNDFFLKTSFQNKYEYKINSFITKNVAFPIKYENKNKNELIRSITEKKDINVEKNEYPNKNDENNDEKRRNKEDECKISKIDNMVDNIDIYGVKNKDKNKNKSKNIVDKFCKKKD